MHWGDVLSPASIRDTILHCPVPFGSFLFWPILTLSSVLNDPDDIEDSWASGKTSHSWDSSCTLLMVRLGLWITRRKVTKASAVVLTPHQGSYCQHDNQAHHLAEVASANPLFPSPHTAHTAGEGSCSPARGCVATQLLRVLQDRRPFSLLNLLSHALTPISMVLRIRVLDVD